MGLEMGCARGSDGSRVVIAAFGIEEISCWRSLPASIVLVCSEQREILDSLIDGLDSLKCMWRLAILQSS
jgi:hypothetical protein